MPFFAEANVAGQVSRVPSRFQQILLPIQSSMSTIIDSPLEGINFSNLSLFLETRYNADDMGWKMLPTVVASSFDLTQGLIPLKEILTTISNSLRDAFRTRHRTHPLVDIDLYQLFRTLKEQGHTFSMVLKVPIGARNSNLILQTLYGDRNSGNYPILIFKRNNKIITRKLRDAIRDAQVDILENPYDLEALLAEGTACEPQ